MSINKQDNVISRLTEWAGIFALGITVGLVIPQDTSLIIPKAQA